MQRLVAEKDYIIVYDILRDGIGVAPVAVCLGMLIGFVVVAGILVSRRNQRKPVAFIVLWLIGWSTCSVIGGGNVLYQHFRCYAWARSGNFEVVEGQVTEFHPFEGAGESKSPESFTVNNINFTYSDANLARGGFRHTFGSKGLLHEGAQVRVSYREGRILKLEILGE